MSKSGITTNGLHSYHDFGECIAARSVGMPNKKVVAVTVPYMSGFYDFSSLYRGAVPFEDRIIEYTFDIIGSREEVQERKTRIMDWLTNVQDEPIWDDDIPARHFMGSFHEAEWEEHETGEHGRLKVAFKCQPFMRADTETSVNLKAGDHRVLVTGQPARVKATPSAPATVRINDVGQAVSVEQELATPLLHGENRVEITGGPVVLAWVEASV